MATLAPVPQIDVDNLAKEKVQEVETLLDSPEDLKLDSIRSCFSILKQIITAADLHRTNDKNNVETNEQSKTENGESIYADYADDHEQFNKVDLTEQFATNSVKWTIRVRAFKSVHRIFHLLLSSSKLAHNKSAVLGTLPDLIRLSFVAATSPYDDLKIQGFQMFRNLINRFASVEEREFPGHSILEQYKTQVLSALKPAFNLDAPPYITAIACQVCSLWICRGLEKESSGLKRAYQLMEPSIEKLESQSINPNSLLYQEIELEQERLDILGSWAQLYITAHEASETSKLLTNLVKNQVGTLVDKWWEALKDYALLIMLSPKTMTVSHDNEHVYTREVALKLFSPIWPKLALAATIWLCTVKTNSQNPDAQVGDTEKPNSIPVSDIVVDDVTKTTSTRKYFHFICGILMNELSRCMSGADPMMVDSLPESTIISLRSICMLLNDDLINKNLLDDMAVAREFYAVLGGILVRHTKLKSPQKSLLRSTLSQIFRLALTKLSDNNEVVQYSLAHLIDSVRAGLEFTPEPSENMDKSNLQIEIANLLEVAKARPDLLEDDHNLLDALGSVFCNILIGQFSSTVLIAILDQFQTLYGKLSKASVIVLNKRLFEVKLSLVKKLACDWTSDKASFQKSESKVFFEAVIKSIKMDQETLDCDQRRVSLAALIRALLSGSNSDNYNNSVAPYLKGLEMSFPVEFKILRDSDLKEMIDTALETLSKSENATKVAKKANNDLKKPASKIVLKADFSNFYAKKS